MTDSKKKDSKNISSNATNNDSSNNANKEPIYRDGGYNPSRSTKPKSPEKEKEKQND